MTHLVFPKAGVGIWSRLAWLAYRIRWAIVPVLRLFGFNEQKMSWEETMFAMRSILQQVGAFNPDVVVGIGVGGTVWGAVLAAHLHDKTFVGLDRSVDRGEKRTIRIVGLSIFQTKELDITDKRVLLVSAELVTGSTTETVRQAISHFTNKVKIACIDYRPTTTDSSGIQPDFFYLCSDFTIQKPWRTTKTYTNPDELVRG